MPEAPLNERVLRLHVAVHTTLVESLMGNQTIVSWRITHEPERIEDGACVGFDEAADLLANRLRLLLGEMHVKEEAGERRA